MKCLGEGHECRIDNGGTHRPKARKPAHLKSHHEFKGGRPVL